MKELLTHAGYVQTKAKLADLQKRFAALEKRTDLSPVHFGEAKNSYRKMMRKYLREIKLYEASFLAPPHPERR